MITLARDCLQVGKIDRRKMPPIGYDNGASSNVFLVDQYQNYEKARENDGYFGLGWPGSYKP